MPWIPVIQSISLNKIIAFVIKRIPKRVCGRRPFHCLYLDKNAGHCLLFRFINVIILTRLWSFFKTRLIIWLPIKAFLGSYSDGQSLKSGSWLSSKSSLALFWSWLLALTLRPPMVEWFGLEKYQTSTNTFVFQCLSSKPRRLVLTAGFWSKPSFLMVSRIFWSWIVITSMNVFDSSVRICINFWFIAVQSWRWPKQVQQKTSLQLLWSFEVRFFCLRCHDWLLGQRRHWLYIDIWSSLWSQFFHLEKGRNSPSQCWY